MTTNTKQRITLFINPSIAKHARAQAVVEDLALTTIWLKSIVRLFASKNSN